ncbi:MAG: pyruvate kinase [Planctomycetales bacterium]|nr:pyruvate kinase [Planctomycetales bacterium]
MNPAAYEPLQHRARTKIVATIGPACRAPDMLARLVGSGVDVFRINMAHGTPQEHNSTISDIREISKDAQRPIGILVDLAGPKIRLGQLTEEPLECRAGDTFRFVRGTQSHEPHDLTSTYEPLVDELDVDDRVLLADGTVAMIVVRKERNEVYCQVTGPGELRSRQGINLPGVKLSVEAMSDVDRENAEWAARSGIDFISLSFVRSPVEVRQLKALVAEANSRAMVISKIEKPEALDNLDEIVQASDGIMVARGDLGVEIDVAEMPVQQKRIIDTCIKYKRPVIVATQMLDSMERSSRPTRAEVTDVANAIIDGADACMLSGETAIGKFPRESVEMMNRIMLSSEKLAERNWKLEDLDFEYEGVHPTSSAVVYHAGQLAKNVDAKVVMVATRSGATALAKSKHRDFIPTIAVSDSEETLRRMTLYWGIGPVAGAPSQANEDLTGFIDAWGRHHGYLVPGDKVVVVTGTGLLAGAHNLIMVHEVR